MVPLGLFVLTLSRKYDGEVRPLMANDLVFYDIMNVLIRSNHAEQKPVEIDILTAIGNVGCFNA
jgi:hypothetical protein